MKLESLYRDVYSQLKLNGLEHDIFSLDIIKGINQSIKNIRSEYVKNGLGGYFSISETIQEFEEDSEYEYLNSGELSKSVLNDVPLQIAVVASNVKLTDNKLLDENQTWNEGDVVEFNNMLYEAVKDITDENTFGKVFDSRKLRMYFPNNGLKYKKGEIVWNPDTNEYFKVTSNFKAEEDTEELEEVFWRKTGKANISANHYPMYLLRSVVLHDNEKQAFTVKGNKLYVNPTVVEMNITYVPEWENIMDLDGEVNIPDQMESAVIFQTVNKLINKLRQRPFRNEEPQSD